VAVLEKFLANLKGTYLSYLAEQNNAGDEENKEELTEENSKKKRRKQKEEKQQNTNEPNFPSILATVTSLDILSHYVEICTPSNIITNSGTEMESAIPAMIMWMTREEEKTPPPINQGVLADLAHLSVRALMGTSDYSFVIVLVWKKIWKKNFIFYSKKSPTKFTQKFKNNFLS
jgi:hypothetical protein